MATGVLEIRGLTKYFGGLRAIDDVNVSISKGELVGVIGPNGAGKTTFFNLITGFVVPDGGEVLVNGVDVAGWSPHRVVQEGVSRTFQITRMFSSLKVIENVIVALLARRGMGILSSSRAHVEEASAILERVGLHDKIGLLAGSLGQGDQRKLELARATATKPNVLLIDEPFSGLSLREVEVLIPLIQKLNKEGLNIVIIEHKLRELMRLARRVLVLNFGRLIADGTPEEIANDEEVVEAYLGKGGGNFGAP
jgi:branched-chain amino acid transport system ATP-binding protein